jgi:hypothetical protein
LDSVNTYQE